MCQCIETICLDKGIFQRIAFHNDRMNRSRKALFGCSDFVSLDQILSLPVDYHSESLKCRITFSKKIEKIEYELYQPKLIRSLRLVEDNKLDYRHKYADRTGLMTLLEQRGQADEILIVKNGCITDTSFSNVVFLRDGRWFTPDSPLLEGTQRASLLLEGKIEAIKIRPGDLTIYQEVRLINAMRNMDDGPSIQVEDIFW